MIPDLRAGELRHLIQIVSLNRTQDSSGGWQEDDGSVFAAAWARIEALSGRELIAAQQKVSDVTHKITIRYQEGILASMNVWYDGRQFQIQAVENPEERNRYLFLLCVERANSAYETPA